MVTEAVVVANGSVPEPFTTDRWSYKDVPYTQNIARSILPKRNIGEHVDYDIADEKKKYEVYMLTAGYTLQEHDENVQKVKVSEDLAIGKVHKIEDFTLIHGNEYLGIVGISSTKTTRHDLLNAIKEFKPSAIITSSKFLNIHGIKVFRDDKIPKYIHYLVPEKLSANDAELVISEDIKVKCFPESHGRKWHEVSEWIAIEIKNPDVFVKVTRKH